MLTVQGQGSDIAPKMSIHTIQPTRGANKGLRCRHPGKKPQLERKIRKGLHEQMALEIYVMFPTGGAGGGVRWSFQRKTLTQSLGRGAGGDLASESK